MKITYQNAVAHMNNLALTHKGSQQYQHTLTINNNLEIKYPGYKGGTDYKALYKGTPPSHNFIVNLIHDNTTPNNVVDVHKFLQHIYNNGTTSYFAPTLHGTQWINQDLQDLIFWVTLQEDINYPRPRFKGIKLPLSRFFEASLIHNGNFYNLKEIHNRTNNHGGPPPSNNKKSILQIHQYTIPSFYY